MSIIIFAISAGVLLDAIVGLVGSRRDIGFGWSFLISVLFTPLIGLIVVLLSPALPAGAPPRYGCLGRSFGCLGTVLLVAIVASLLLGLALLFVPIV